MPARFTFRAAPKISSSFSRTRRAAAHIRSREPCDPRGNKGALRIPFLSFQFPRRPECAAKLLCFHIIGGFRIPSAPPNFSSRINQPKGQSLPCTPRVRRFSVFAVFSVWPFRRITIRTSLDPLPPTPNSFVRGNVTLFRPCQWSDFLERRLASRRRRRTHEIRLRT